MRQAMRRKPMPPGRRPTAVRQRPHPRAGRVPAWREPRRVWRELRSRAARPRTPRTGPRPPTRMQWTSGSRAGPTTVAPQPMPRLPRAGQACRASPMTAPPMSVRLGSALPRPRPRRKAGPRPAPPRRWPARTAARARVPTPDARPQPSRPEVVLALAPTTAAARVLVRTPTSWRVPLPKARRDLVPAHPTVVRALVPTPTARCRRPEAARHPVLTRLAAGRLLQIAARRRVLTPVPETRRPPEALQAPGRTTTATWPPAAAQHLGTAFAAARRPMVPRRMRIGGKKPRPREAAAVQRRRRPSTLRDLDPTPSAAKPPVPTHLRSPAPRAPGSAAPASPGRRARPRATPARRAPGPPARPRPDRPPSTGR